MTTESKGIYHWKLGDVSLARMCKKVYTKVRVVKDKNGLFYDDKVLGISCNEDGSLILTKELCYFVETCRTKEKLWLPYTCMHLAERSRPFYGTDKISPGKVKNEPSPMKTPRKRKLQEEHIVPLQVKLSNLRKPDFNATYDMQHVPLKQGKYENAFREFVRRGKERLFDQYFELLKLDVDENKDSLDFLMNVNASTEDKFELVIKNTVSEKELENYLKQCWRYNLVQKQSAAEPKDTRDLSDVSNTSLLKSEVTVHIPWCLVCGKPDKLRACTNCPASFHLPCRREWLLTIIHRKKTPEKSSKPVTFIQKILSSTRTKCSVQKDKENVELCPSCMWGPKVGYDDVVWHKLGACPWWPAKVLTPGEVPSCLLARSHSPHDWPLRYYDSKAATILWKLLNGTLNHSWGTASRMCLFLPSHLVQLGSREESLRGAVMDASDDYISVYLT